jgi:hypothetical protein
MSSLSAEQKCEGLRHISPAWQTTVFLASIEVMQLLFSFTSTLFLPPLVVTLIFRIILGRSLLLWFSSPRNSLWREGSGGSEADSFHSLRLRKSSQDWKAAALHPCSWSATLTALYYIISISLLLLLFLSTLSFAILFIIIFINTQHNIHHFLR